jgi:hypothetical protein
MNNVSVLKLRHFTKNGHADFDKCIPESFHWSSHKRRSSHLILSCSTLVVTVQFVGTWENVMLILVTIIFLTAFTILFSLPSLEESSQYDSIFYLYSHLYIASF